MYYLSMLHINRVGSPRAAYNPAWIFLLSFFAYLAASSRYARVFLRRLSTTVSSHAADVRDEDSDILRNLILKKAAMRRSSAPPASP